MNPFSRFSIDLPDEPSIARTLLTGYPYEEKDVSGLLEDWYDEYCDRAYEETRDARLEGLK